MKPPVAFDTETTGLNPWGGARIFSYSISDINTGRTEVIRTTNNNYWDGMRGVFDSFCVVMHNAKFDLRMVGKALGEPVWRRAEFADTMIMSKIVRNDHYSHALDDLAFDWAGYHKIDKEVHDMARLLGGMQNVPQEVMERYQVADGERTVLLYQFFWPKIQQDEKWISLYEMEMELIRTSLDVESYGLVLDRQSTCQIIRSLQIEVQDLLKQIQELTWEEFNPFSVLDKRSLLFDQLGLVPHNFTQHGQPKTDKHLLLEHREDYPICDLILKHNSYKRGITTLESYLDVAGEDGLIHPTIHTSQAVTSRQACSNPNLQNVAKEGVLLNPYPIPARRCFTNRAGYLNLYVDYSGIEMRLLIHYSQEPELIACLKHGGDPHDLAAEIFYGERFLEAEGDERKKLRGAGKNANFACPYGAGPDKIIQTLGLPAEVGASAFRRYRDAFPKLVSLTRTISNEVYDHGFITTVFGRKLHVPKYEAYLSTNYLIQSTASDILKHAENQVHQYNQAHPGPRILLPIHDELVIEYPLNQMTHLRDYITELTGIMTSFDEFSVPLEVSFEYSSSDWGEKQSVYGNLLDHKTP